MKREITLGNHTIKYTLKKYKKSRSVRLSVKQDGTVLLTTPLRLKESVAEKFLTEKFNWLISSIDHFKKSKITQTPKLTRKDYLKHKESVRDLVKERIEYFNKVYGLDYNKIFIKDQKTCWGSCSKKKNLNFNYKLIFLPEKLRDYIIVHELCHLKKLNHSKNFWKLVSYAFPDYKEVKKELRKYSSRM